MPAPDTTGVEPEDEPLGGGAGDQQDYSERALAPDQGAAAGGDSHAPEIAEDTGLADRLEVDPERGDVKG